MVEFVTWRLKRWWGCLWKFVNSGVSRCSWILVERDNLWRKWIWHLKYEEIKCRLGTKRIWLCQKPSTMNNQLDTVQISRSLGNSCSWRRVKYRSFPFAYGCCRHAELSSKLRAKHSATSCSKHYLGRGWENTIKLILEQSTNHWKEFPLISMRRCPVSLDSVFACLPCCTRAPRQSYCYFPESYKSRNLLTISEER